MNDFSTSMANRTKNPDDRQTEPLGIKISPKLKRQVDAMAISTAVTTTDRVRVFLEGEVAKWKAQYGIVEDDEEERDA